MGLFKFIRSLLTPPIPNNEPNDTVDSDDTEVIERHIIEIDINKIRARKYDPVASARRERMLERKEERSDNKHKRWAIIRIFVENYNLQKCTNRYEYKKIIENLEYLRKYLKEYQYDIHDVEIAIRLIRRKHIQGECEAPAEAIYSFNPKDFSSDMTLNIDLSQNLIEGLLQEEKYWDEVIKNYKRQHARINRLQYLVEGYCAEKMNPLIQKYPNVIAKADELMKKYETLLDAAIAAHPEGSRKFKRTLIVPPPIPPSARTPPPEDDNQQLPL